MRITAYALALLLVACGDEASLSPYDAGALDTEPRVLGDQAAVQAFATTERVSGDLVIGGHGSGITQLELPALREVEGDVVIKWSDALARVALPNLVRVRDLRVEGNGALTTLELPALAGARQLVVRENPRLTTLSLPSLAQIGSLGVGDNALLERVSMPVLTLARRDDVETLGGMGFWRNPALAELELPRLSESPSLSVQDNAVLPTLSLPALTRLHMDARVDGAALRSISMPALVSLGELSVWSSHLLTSVDLRALETARKIELNATSLRSLSLPRLQSIEVLWLSGGLQRFEASELARIGGELAGFSVLAPSALRFLSLPKLRIGCDELLGLQRIPECALASSLPMCPREGLNLVAGCTCAPDGDLQAARCPDDAGTPLPIEGGLDGGVLDAG